MTTGVLTRPYRPPTPSPRAPLRPAGDGRPTRPAPLPAEEQLELAALARDNGCARARARLVQANIGLVASIARRFHCRSLAFEDLVSEGMIGLVRAIDEFDPSRCVRFSSFAARLIERSIQHAVGEASGPVRLPPKARRLMARWRRAAQRFEMVHGVPAEPTDLAQELGVSLRAARSLEVADAMISGGTVPPDAIGTPCPADTAATGTAADGSTAELVERIREGVDRLDPCSAAVVRLTFGLSGSPQLSLRSIAEQTGLSVERVRYTLQRALGTLRRAAGTPGTESAGRRASERLRGERPHPAPATRRHDAPPSAPPRAHARDTESPDRADKGRGRSRPRPPAGDSPVRTRVQVTGRTSILTESRRTSRPSTSILAQTV